MADRSSADLLRDIRDRLRELPRKLVEELARPTGGRPQGGPARGANGRFLRREEEAPPPDAKTLFEKHRAGRWPAVQGLGQAAGRFVPQIGGLTQLATDIKGLIDAVKAVRAAFKPPVLPAGVAKPVGDQRQPFAPAIPGKTYPVQSPGVPRPEAPTRPARPMPTPYKVQGDKIPLAGAPIPPGVVQVVKPSPVPPAAYDVRMPGATLGGRGFTPRSGGAPAPVSPRPAVEPFRLVGDRPPRPERPAGPAVAGLRDRGERPTPPAPPPVLPPALRGTTGGRNQPDASSARGTAAQRALEDNRQDTDDNPTENAEQLPEYRVRTERERPERPERRERPQGSGMGPNGLRPPQQQEGGGVMGMVRNLVGGVFNLVGG